MCHLIALQGSRSHRVSTVVESEGAAGITAQRTLLERVPVDVPPYERAGRRAVDRWKRIGPFAGSCEGDITLAIDPAAAALKDREPWRQLYLNQRVHGRIGQSRG